jgi:NDP-sugar pyrophosphorylase family protein
VADLYRLPIEPGLAKWLQRFDDLGDLLKSAPQLFVALLQTTILGTVEEGATVIGPALIGNGSIVRANSVIVGPVILGRDVVVNHGTIVRDHSYIGSNCHIDSGTIITKSLVFDTTTISEMASVRCSIIGVGCTISTKAALGLGSSGATGGTFVGDKSVIGAGCWLNEGAVVAPHTTIEAHTIRQAETSTLLKAVRPRATNND